MLAPVYASPCIVHSATAHLASCIFFIILHLARREEAGGQRAGSGGAQLGEQLAVEENRKEGEGVLGEDEHQTRVETTTTSHHRRFGEEGVGHCSALRLLNLVG